MKTKVMFSALGTSVWVVLLSSDTRGDAQEKAQSVGKPEFKWHVPQRPLSDILGELAKASGQDPDDYRMYRSQGGAGRFSKKGSVAALKVGDKTYAIAVQTVEPPGSPGLFAQQIVLLTPQGRILDRLQCAINVRYGRTEVDILPKPDPDGAQVVIRFVGRRFPPGEENLWHNWHDIGSQGKVWKFWAKESHTPNQWNERGLCRLRIADGKWRVVFPKLELPDLRAARALDIGFLVAGEAKHVSVNDPKQVRDLLSAIDIPGREQGDVIGEWDRGLWDVTFVMPDGKKFGFAFVTPTLLCDSGRWGRIYLGSPGFYKMLRALATRETGQPVRFLYDDARPN